MATNASSPIKRRRGRPRKSEVDHTKPLQQAMVDQIEGRPMVDGPTGVVPEEDVKITAGKVVGDPEAEVTADAIRAAQALLARAERQTENALVSNLAPEFVDAMGPQRAQNLVAEHGEFVQIEPQFSNFFVPDYESGPKQRAIGQEIHRYYKPKQLTAARFDPQTRRRIDVGSRGWVPLRDYQKMLDRLGEGSVNIVNSSHATEAA